MKIKPAKFNLVSDFEPAGDQPQAIKAILENLGNGLTDTVLLGVTGSGKTYTAAQVIAAQDRPTLIMAPNKTLAAQLYGEMKAFFPDNAVEYFVSYYDYYQPEAYVPRSDTFIEKESSINEQIDRLRHSATRSLIERRDVIVVASVSCIYGIGSPDAYKGMTLDVQSGQTLDRDDFIRDLVSLHFIRNDMDFKRGTFRARGDIIEVFPAHLDDTAWRLMMFDDEVEEIIAFDPLTGVKQESMDKITIYANSHYVTEPQTIQAAMKEIKKDLKIRLDELNENGQLLEAQRLQQRTTFDLEMMQATGTCNGIENYSRYLTGRKPGDPPPTLFEYLPSDALLFVDESHVAVPQIGGMYKGDRSRKLTLTEHGFRLPSCKDNRPLKFEEWNRMRPQTIYISATPGPWELEQTGDDFIEQVVRPTGLVDPITEIRPTKHQVDDLMEECRKTVADDGRVLVTTLTKRMAENLSEYLYENGLKVRYLHSDIDTLERIEILRDLRLGEFDILVGINLLREGLDIPECKLVAILDADKEGFLRSQTSLIQTIGRAARNVDGKAVLYADKVTGALKAALEETERRRNKQLEHNKKMGITPETIRKEISNIVADIYNKDEAEKARVARARGLKVAVSARGHKGGHKGPGFAEDQTEFESPEEMKGYLKDLEKRMKEAAANLEFEEAAKIRDEIKYFEGLDLGLTGGGSASVKNFKRKERS